MDPLQLVFTIMMLAILALGIMRGLEHLGWWFYSAPLDYDEWSDGGDESHNADPSQQPLCDDTNGVAMPQNTHNGGIVFCESIVALTTAMNQRNEMSVAVAEIQGAITAMALVVELAKKADKTPKLGETDAIKYGLGITPGSTNPLYALAKAALADERARIRQADDDTRYHPLTPQQESRRQWVEGKD